MNLLGMNIKKRFHEPVLLKEAIEYLRIKPGEKYIDATVGGGGHAQAMIALGGRVLGIDCDPEAISAARKYLSSACPLRRDVGVNTSWRLARGSFAGLQRIAQAHGFNKVRGILFDLGVSGYQLETADRGFSFNLEGPLDMRMNPDLKVKAADLVNGLNKRELNELFEKLGEEDDSGRISQAICCARQIAPITTTKQLAEIIVKARRKRGRFEKTHPATRCFQALRIAVNDELNNLRIALPQAVGLLKKEGRLLVISFHSGEDRIVKQFFRENLRLVTKKPIRATKEEIVANPRSRSAKLRVGEKR